VELNYRERKKDGAWSKLKSIRLGRDEADDLPDGTDRTIISMLAGAQGERHSYYYGSSEGASKYTLTDALARAALPAMCRTGRCYLRKEIYDPIEKQLQQTWGTEPHWLLNVEVARNGKEGYRVAGFLERNGEKRALSDPLLLTSGGLVFWGN